VTPEHTKLSGTRYATGEAAPATGVYRVSHAEHRLPEEITVLLGQSFPRCAKCSVAVKFELVRPMQCALPPGTMTLNELPVLEDETGTAASVAS
jgi:hypothetical protein